MIDITSACEQRLPAVALVAEKDMMTRAILSGLLSSEGCRVFQAEDLSEAISRIRDPHEIAILLADGDMPGWNIIVEQALNRKSDVFVVVALGNETAPDTVELLRHGIDFCLRKPLRYDDLHRILYEKLSNWEQYDEMNLR